MPARISDAHPLCSEQSKLFDNSKSEFWEDLLSAEQLALRLKVPLKTIRGWRYRRVLPTETMCKVGPRLVRYRWCAVQRWLQEKGGIYG